MRRSGRADWSQYLPNDHLRSEGRALGNRQAGVEGELSLGGSTTLLLLGRALRYVLALGNSVILARTLGVNRLGIYAYAMGVTALFGLLPNIGISTIIIRTIDQDPETGIGVVRAAQPPSTGSTHHWVWRFRPGERSAGG